MKGIVVGLVIGLVVLAVAGICVLALITSTTRGTEWLVGGRRKGAPPPAKDSSADPSSGS